MKNMKTCDKCCHLALCNWLAENATIKFPKTDGQCDMFNTDLGYDWENANTAFDHTVVYMRSPDYRERFKAEYQQTKIRYEKLKAFNTSIEAAVRMRGYEENGAFVEPRHTCPADLLREQQRAMGEYLHILEVRAYIEDIDLNN